MEGLDVIDPKHLVMTVIGREPGITYHRTGGN